ncbi:MAG: DUF6208 family protein [Cyanobacteria bacterium J06626_14]
MTNRWMAALRWAWEIPLAIASFILFKVIKWVIGVLYAGYLGINRAVASQWRVLSVETLASPLSLPVLMTKGPRWNTHAIIGTVGPFSVTKEIALDTQAIAQSARSWTAAIYSYPAYETVGNLGSLETPLPQPEPVEATPNAAESTLRTPKKTAQPERNMTLTVPPGRYSIGLRYYHWSDTPVLPTVTIDGVPAIDPQSVAPTVNAFYRTLSERTNWFYRLLHSYVFTVLKLRRWLPASFVQQEYLPVGAPETDFFYDAIEKGDRLIVSLAPPLIEHFDVYLTTYNRASFPLVTKVLTVPKYVSQPMACDGFYLFRVRPKSPQHTTLSQDWLAITRDHA